MNALLLEWLAAGSSASGPHDKTLEPLLYLCDLGYIQPADLLDENLAFKVAVDNIVRKVAGMLGYAPDEPLPPALDIFDEDGELRSDMFDAVLAEAGVTEDDFEKLLAPLTEGGFGEQPEGTVCWKGIGEPVDTNGEWAKDKAELCWNAKAVAGPELPSILFALWTVPDKQYQLDHFGKVAIDRDLADYNVSLRRLPEEDARKWNSFVDGLRPGADVSNNVTAFRFQPTTTQPAGEHTHTESPPQIAQILSKILVNTSH